MKILIPFFLIFACNTAQKTAPAATTPSSAPISAAANNIVPAAYDAQGKLIKVEKNDEQWRAELNDMEYRVLRHEGTERAFTGDLWNNHEKGVYTCRGCGLPLFDADTKFDSGTGWPSYYQPVEAAYVKENKDASLGMVRTEVECARCGGHLGHVFDDGPKPTGLRYCINSASLDFVAKR